MRVRSAVTTIVKERLKVIQLRGGAQKEEVARVPAGRINHYLHSLYAREYVSRTLLFVERDGFSRRPSVGLLKLMDARQSLYERGLHHTGSLALPWYGKGSDLKTRTVNSSRCQRRASFT